MDIMVSRAVCGAIIFVSVLSLSFSSSDSDQYPCQNANIDEVVRRVTVPHDACPGYIVTSVAFIGQKLDLEAGCVNSNSDNSSQGLFDVMPNGDIIVKTSLTDFLFSEIDLTVKSNIKEEYWHDRLAARVADGSEMLQFIQNSYDGHVFENLPSGSVVRDLDNLVATANKLSLSSVRYALIDGPSELFEIAYDSSDVLRIVTREPLDREIETQYMLTIAAVAQTGIKDPAFCRVWVHVDDVNDNVPEMSAMVYEGRVHVSDDIGKEIVSVRASDADGDDIEYNLIGGRAIFDIDRHNGSVFLAQPGQVLKEEKYEMRVFASDSGDAPSLSSVIKIHVDGLVTKASSSSVVNRARREVRPVLTYDRLESITGEVLDLDNNYYEIFALKEPAPKYLEIHPSTGTVRLKANEKFDYETQKQINFTIVITRADNPSYYAEQPVKIVIADVNDELPEFKNVPRPFLTTVSANAAAGTSVYQLMAQDADENSIVRYKLESGGEDRFEVDSESGIVRTKGNQPFRSKEYEIGVSAEDISAVPVQRSPTHSLKILVGERDPQFFETQYVANVPESAAEQNKIVEIKALSHQDFPLNYELYTDTGAQSNEFAIDQSTGVIDLLRTLDYEKDPQQYHLKARVIESGRPARTSTVNVIINLVDVNDNIPTFPLSQYIVQGIAETVAIGTDIIQVTATDLDSVTNSQLTYSVSDSSFTVQTLNNIGYIKTAKRLDYDGIADHTYNFTIIATDNGSPLSHSGSAMVRVSVTNVNDEDPVFAQAIEHVQVSEDAPPNTVVHVVQAYDPDGDDVTFSFTGGRLLEGPFSIDPKSGIITLIGMLDKTRVSYILNVTATDNGRCCGGTTSRTSRGVVVIEIKDINNNAPRFVDCATYKPSVMENENVGTSVIQVRAIDLDTGANGNVTYSLVKSTDQSSDRFDIDSSTGIVRTADVFDREAQIGVTDYGVTVKAEDQGSPTLAGFCTFRVKIADKNDNPPVFNLPHYSTSIEERSMIGKRVKQVYATDRDAGENGKVEYFMREDPSGFFAINQYTGWVTVARPMSGRDQVQIQIEARDKGTTPKHSIVRMDVEITQTINAYPQWVEDYSLSSVKISENAPVNTLVKVLKAISSIPDSQVNYVIQPGETLETNGQPRSFYLRNDDKNKETALLTYRPLDYEALPQYVLTIKAANRATNSLHNDTRVIIDLIDENDEIPQFVGLDENGRYPGSVAENLEPGAEVITVTATDKDEFPDFRKINYRIKEVGVDFEKFTINRQTGLIRTTASFDREQKNEYYVTVVAEDGAPSARPNHYPPGTPNQGEAEVQIRVTDMNDNVPYFKDRTYTARVPENTDPGTVVITVTAEDKDEENRLTYSITGGNMANAFEVVPDLGEIKVRGHLDYENGPREYRLLYRVFDDKFANTTTVVIQVLDVNDNAPKFDNAIYNVTDVQEEEQGISKNNPKYLLTVRATDPDVDRGSHIRYGLTGQFADDGTFIVNEHTGEIYLTKSLDRDQARGRPVWNFNVLAHDEPDAYQPSLTGYAEVRVIPRDINDNAPVFDRNRLIGHIPEHSRSGMTVLTVIATDPDNGNNGSVTYSLKQVPTKGSQPLFSIDSHMGLISTMQSNALDRETQSEYYVIVQAKDRGSPPMSASTTVTIIIDDVNDHAPMFVQSHYQATMSESLEKGASIVSVSASDRDVGSNAKLTYTLREQDREHFYISSIEATNTGVLKVFKPIDFDSLLNPVFNVTVYVQDTDPSHIDTAYIEVKVTDFNDNAPVFSPNSKKVTIFENVTVSTTLHRFSASDRDQGLNKQFTYSIDRLTDPERQFAVDGNGLVITAKPLDRETMSGHRVHVLAVDKGTPSQTGTGTLLVTLMDVNDNYPEFATAYRPVIYENRPIGQTVVQISASDRDTAANGPPFEFWLPCGGGCPCPANPSCGNFSFKFLPGGGDNGYGSGIITSMVKFDREKCKEYYLPIIMKDSGHPPMSGTNTLTIVIGDINDNPHHSGHKDILVYSYHGSEFESVPLGNVYAEDEDDWDVDNKTFSFVDREPERIFRLDHQSGQLFIKGRIMEGQYNFRVKVYDVEWRREVISTVTVHVKEIRDDAVSNSGSVRFQGVTAEEFVSRPRVIPDGESDNSKYSQSKYDQLQEMIASWLRVPAGNVQIFTVKNHPTLSRTVDVRYAAHGSPYYRPAKLNGLVIEHKYEIEKRLGIRLLMAPIDECSTGEHCESVGCSSSVVTDSKPLLINTNGTSLVGLMAYVQVHCMCAARSFSADGNECRPDTCLNGGTCVQSSPASVECRCLDGFDGPRCQQTRHSFSGEGWAWYEPLGQCEEGHTSLELMTLRENGLIMYQGPLRDLADGDPEDFVILEMKNGYPFLRVNHGTGEIKLTIDGRDKSGVVRLGKISDGLWHRIDIFKNGRQIRLVVDRCDAANVNENVAAQTSVEDRRACEAASETQGDGKYVNINVPLQLGGRSNPKIKYPQHVTKDGFNGCIKNFIHNGQLYDLHIGKVGEHRRTEDGCQREDEVCSHSGTEVMHRTNRCGQNGICIGNLVNQKPRCVCKPGWRGHRCSFETTVKDFRQHSFIEWDFQDKYYALLDKSGSYRTQLQMMFRTRQNNTAVLWKAQNAQKSEYIVLEISAGRLRFRYNLGSGENMVVLSHVNVADGTWHTAYVHRVGQWAELRVDGGEGPYFNESFGAVGGHLEIRISQRNVFAGGDVRFPSSNSPPLVDHDYENGCMNDVRFNGDWFPMEPSENFDNRVADYLARSQNTIVGCTSNVCNQVTRCPAGLLCHDLWRYAECRCPEGKRLIEGEEWCVNIDECRENEFLCYYGTCVDLEDGYMCQCSEGYGGLQCGERRDATSVAVGTSALLTIMLCALILLILILMLIIYTRRHRPQMNGVYVDPHDDIRENIIHYDEEGVGEEDQDAYDINKLKKPVTASSSGSQPDDKQTQLSSSDTLPLRAPGTDGEMTEFIGQRLHAVNSDPSAPPYDSVREYAYEGAGSTAGSLSSVASTDDNAGNDSDGGGNWDELGNWGPRFHKLADVYGLSY